MITKKVYKSGSELSRYFGETENKALYYESGAELPGFWEGLAASYLELDGPVQNKVFQDLAHNRKPGSGKKLTARNSPDRVSAYEFCFSVPKSISVKSELAGDGKLREIARDSAVNVVCDMEQEAATRVRKNKSNTIRKTGNWVCAIYEHRTSRPVRGVPDPQLHFHVVVFNATYDEVEKKWKALYIKPVMDNLGHYRIAFNALLMKRLKDAGYPITINDKSFEISGLQKYVERFSNRKQVIEQAAIDLGIESPEGKAKLAMTTREAKLGKLNLDRLKGKWKKRVTPQELAEIIEIGAPQPQRTASGPEGRRWADEVVFEDPLWQPEDEMPQREAWEEQQLRQKKIDDYKRRKGTPRRDEAEPPTQQELIPKPEDWDAYVKARQPEVSRMSDGRSGEANAQDSKSKGDEHRSYSVQDGRQVPLPLGRPRAKGNEGQWWQKQREKAAKRWEKPDYRTAEVPEAAVEALAAARKEFFAKEEVGSHLALRSVVLKHGKGEITPEEASAALFQSDLKPVVVEEQSYFCDPVIQGLQKEIIQFASNGRGVCISSLGPEGYLSRFKGKLTEWDKDLLKLLFDSRDKITIVKHGGVRRKAAWAATAIDGMKQHGLDVIMLGATHRTVEQMKNRYLFNRSGMSVDHYLQEQRGDALLEVPNIVPHAMTVLFVEDAGSLSTRQLADLVALQKKTKCRMVLLGDNKSLRSSEGGNPLELFRVAGLRSLESKLIKSREDEADNDRVYMQEQKGVDICKRMDFRGQVSVVPDSDEVYRDTAERYIKAIKSKRTALTVAPDYETQEHLTAVIRTQMREAKLLGKREKVVLQRRSVWLGDSWKEARQNIKRGMTVHFHKPTRGFKLGEKAHIFCTLPGGGLVVWKRGFRIAIRPKLKNISVTQKGEIALSKGDRIQLKRSTNSKLFGYRMRAGKVVQVEKVTPDTIILKSGHAFPRDWGHFEHAYTAMPWQVQGRRVDDIIVASHRTAWKGLDREKLLAAQEAGKQTFHCVVDNADDLAAAWDNEKPRLNALDLAERPEHVFEQHQRYEAWQTQQIERMKDEQRRSRHV